MPDVGVYLAADVLELVQISDGNASVGHGHASDFTKRVGLEKAQSLGAVAENESFPVSSQAPPFAAVTERPTGRKACEVVDERNIGLPRELHELAVPLLQAFGEI